MSKYPETWQVPVASLKVLRVARIAWLFMLVLASTWTAFTLHDMILQGSVNGWQAVMLLSVVAWFGLAWHLRPQNNKAESLVLHWYEDPQLQAATSLSRQKSLLAIQESHWRTADGQAVTLTAKIDLGNCLLIRIVFDNAILYRWVRDSEVPGPWRWRIMAGLPSSKKEPLPKQRPDYRKRIHFR